MDAELLRRAQNEYDNLMKRNEQAANQGKKGGNTGTQQQASDNDTQQWGKATTSKGKAGKGSGKGSGKYLKAEGNGGGNTYQDANKGQQTLSKGNSWKRKAEDQTGGNNKVSKDQCRKCFEYGHHSKNCPKWWL